MKRIWYNTGSPIRVSTERSVPKNFPVSFEGVAITPVDYQESIFTIPSSENLEQFKKLFLRTAEVALENHQRSFWESLVKTRSRPRTH